MKSLDKVFNIIELLKNEKSLRLQDIADSLNLNKSTTHRILYKLVKNNYLKKDNENKKYSLGFKFLEISGFLIEDSNLIRDSRESVVKLNKLTRETIHLAMIVSDQIVYMDKKESTQGIRMYSQIGRSVPLYCTGVGKAILAFQNHELRDKLIDTIKFYKYTDNTITNRDALIKELEKIKKNGVALDREEHEKGIGCIAAPIRDHSNNVIASISITALLYRMNIEKLFSFRGVLVEECRNISKKLGFNNNTVV